MSTTKLMIPITRDNMCRETPVPWGNIHETEIPWPGPKGNDERLYRTLAIKSIPEQRTVALVVGWKPDAEKPLATPTAEAQANAELIVRAVNSHGELLAVLKAIAAQLDCPSRNTTDSSYRRDGSVIISSDVRESVRAAIAKAEGKEV